MNLVEDLYIKESKDTDNMLIVLFNHQIKTNLNFKKPLICYNLQIISFKVH